MHSQEDALMRISRHLPYLKPALKKVANYILEDPGRAKLQRIKEVAGACQVSEATVTRFVKALQFRSFPEFKIAIATSAPSQSEGSRKAKKFFYADLDKNDSFESAIAKITFQNIQSLEKTQRMISYEEIERAIAAIENAHFIAIYCAGSSIPAGHSLRQRFYRIGKPCLMYGDPIEQAVSASLLTSKTLAIGISSSGQTKFVVDALKLAKASGATTLCLTDYGDSPIAQYADIKLFTFTKQSDFLQYSLLSRMSQILTIDALFACYFLKYYDRLLETVERSAMTVKNATQLVYL